MRSSRSPSILSSSPGPGRGSPRSGPRRLLLSRRFAPGAGDRRIPGDLPGTTSNPPSRPASRPRTSAEPSASPSVRTRRTRSKRSMAAGTWTPRSRRSKTGRLGFSSPSPYGSSSSPPTRDRSSFVPEVSEPESFRPTPAGSRKKKARADGRGGDRPPFRPLALPRQRTGGFREDTHGAGSGQRRPAVELEWTAQGPGRDSRRPASLEAEVDDSSGVGGRHPYPRSELSDRPPPGSASPRASDEASTSRRNLGGGCGSSSFDVPDARPLTEGQLSRKPTPSGDAVEPASPRSPRARSPRADLLDPGAAPMLSSVSRPSGSSRTRRSIGSPAGRREALGSDPAGNRVGSHSRHGRARHQKTDQGAGGRRRVDPAGFCYKERASRPFFYARKSPFKPPPPHPPRRLEKTFDPATFEERWYRPGRRTDDSSPPAPRGRPGS